MATNTANTSMNAITYYAQPATIIETSASKKSLWQKISGCAGSCFDAMKNNFGMGFLINTFGNLLVIPMGQSTNNSQMGQSTNNTEEIIPEIEKILSSITPSRITNPGLALAAIAFIPIAEEILVRGIVQNCTKKITKFFLSKISSWKNSGKDETYSSKISKVVSASLSSAAHTALLPLTSLFDKITASVNFIFSGIDNYFIVCQAYEKDGLAGSIGVQMGKHASQTLFEYFTSLPKRLVSKIK